MRDRHDEFKTWSDAFKTEALGLLLGERLGAGIDRQVFAHAGNPEYVVKVEAFSNDRFQNVYEWLTWQRVCEEELEARALLAPCAQISSGGGFLVQHRTSPVLQCDLPARLPAWLTDLKEDNWGRLPDGRVVCHDYGTNLALLTGLRSRRTRRAEWWR